MQRGCPPRARMAKVLADLPHLAHAFRRVDSAQPKPQPFSPPEVAGPARPTRHVWLLSYVVEGSVLVFTVLTAAAIALYPGGTFWNHARRGHSFWHNFLCDLLQTPTMNGSANALGAQLATFGMLALVCAMVAFVGLVPSLLGEARHMTRQVRSIVMMACGLTACVPLLPSDRFGALHAAAVFVAGIPVSLALLALVSTLLRQPEIARWLRVLSVILCLTVFSSLALYAAEVVFDAPLLRVVPTLARVANLTLIAWLIGLARVARARNELTATH